VLNERVTTIMAQQFTPAINIESVVRVYSGQRDRCCCGCAGKYRYASAFRDYGSQRRGYEVSDDEVSDRSVKIVLNKILANIDQAEFTDEYAPYVWVEVGNRQYIAYFEE
jgi:hypothetical protein